MTWKTSVRLASISTVVLFSKETTMGVDFKWGGSASYPRYYEEVEEIAVKCFGATLNPDFTIDEKKVQKSLINPYLPGRSRRHLIQRGNPIK